MNWAKVVSRQRDESRRAPRSVWREMLAGADVFVGLSTGNIVTDEMIR